MATETNQLTKDEILRKSGGLDLAYRAIGLSGIQESQEQEAREMDAHRKRMDEHIAKKNGQTSHYQMQDNEGTDGMGNISVGDHYYPAQPPAPLPAQASAMSTAAKVATGAALLFGGGGIGLGTAALLGYLDKEPTPIVAPVIPNEVEAPTNNPPTTTPPIDTNTQYGLRIFKPES